MSFKEQLKTIRYFSIEEIFNAFAAGGKIGNFDLKIYPNLHVYYIKGVRCAYCGIEGAFFAKEKYVKGWQAKIGREKLTLFSLSKNGKNVYPMTIDHIKPKSRGGTNHFNNLQPCCWLCNQKKGNVEKV